MRSRPERIRQEQRSTAHDSDSGGKTVIRVKRGALRRFDQLKTKSEGLPVEVKWDRRTGERRSSTSAEGTERRSGERRQQPPFTWEAADFVVVGDRTPEEEPEPGTEPLARRRGSK